MSNIWNSQVSWVKKSETTSSREAFVMPRVDVALSTLTMRQKRIQGLGWTDRFKGESYSTSVAQELANTNIKKRRDTSSSSVDESTEEKIEIAPMKRAFQYYSDPDEKERFLSATALIALMLHQLSGITFGFQCEQNPELMGGIWGDVTRMGKSLMILEFILKDLQELIKRDERRFGAPTLIVVPKMALFTLARELKKHYGPNPPLIVVFIRSPKQMRAWQRQNLLSSCDVVVTSYSVVAACYKNPTSGNLPFSIHWRRLVCDEAHKLSNEKTDYFESIMEIKADYRWYVSATVIQNSIADLRACFRFLRMDEKKIARLINDLDSDEFRETMQSVLLRRTPADVPDAHIPRVDAAGNIFMYVCVCLYNHVMLFFIGIKDICVDFYDEAEYDLYCHIYAMSRSKLREDRQQQAAPRTSKLSTNRELTILLKLRQLCVSWPIIKDLEKADLPPGMRFPNISRDGREKTAAYMRHALYVLPRIKCNDDGTDGPVKSLGKGVLPLVSTKERCFIKHLFKHVVPAGDKIILFCSWVTPLQRLLEFMRQRAVLMGLNPDTHSGACIISGEDEIQIRDRIITTMANNPNIHCLLITFGSGELSLDLSMANHNIMYDIWWNPARTEQAFDRIGGLGQKKTLHAGRMIVNETIEEVIRRICERKQDIAAKVYGEKKKSKEILETPHVETEGFARALIDWIIGT